MFRSFLPKPVILACMLSFILFSLPSIAQVTSEVVLQVPSVNAKNYANVKQNLSQVQGVQVVKYCSSENFFMLSVDRTVQPDDTAIETAMKNLGMEFFFKDGGFAAALTNCKDNDKGSVSDTDQTNPQ